MESIGRVWGRYIGIGRVGISLGRVQVLYRYRKGERNKIYKEGGGIGRVELWTRQILIRQLGKGGIGR